MRKIISINPSNYEVLGEVKPSSEEEVIQKVEKAHKVEYEWKTIGLEKRIKLISKIIDKLKDNKEELALLVTKEVGMPISQSRFDVDMALDYLRWYLANATEYLSPEIVYKDKKMIHTVFYEPLGVAAVITPWNFPVSNFVWGVAQNLIVGNTVVYKTSEECLLLGKLLEKIIDGAKLPEGVLSMVYGDSKIGEFLVHQNIDLISFMGSTKVGKHLYQVASEKFIKAVCELGGSAPGIVFPDADLDLAIETIYTYRFSNCGQTCDGLKRLIVHKSIFNEVVDKLKIRLASVKVGNPEDEAVEIGPLVAKRQLELIEEQVNDAVRKGAKVVLGGRRIKNSKGAFYEPTILTNINKDMRVWQEEVFGPVLPIVDFDIDNKAIRIANDTKYGLGSYVFTKNKKKILEIASQIDTGMVSINGASYLMPSSPFGGNKDSGIGREHGKFGFYELTKVKVVAL